MYICMYVYMYMYTYIYIYIYTYYCGSMDLARGTYSSVHVPVVARLFPSDKAILDFLL